MRGVIPCFSHVAAKMIFSNIGPEFGKASTADMSLSAERAPTGVVLFLNVHLRTTRCGRCGLTLSHLSALSPFFYFIV